MAEILDGKKISADILMDIQREIAAYQERGVRFNLTVVLVGEHPASASYVRSKKRTAEKLGMEGEVIHLPESVTQVELLHLVDKLNADDDVDGILVQLPLPNHINEQEILLRIQPDKDVDGFHPLNAGLGFVGMPRVWPCTPFGIIEMLHREGIAIAGKHAVVVGRSNIVGKPMAMLLLQEQATVTVCHSRTQNLAEMTGQADILVVAVGRAHLIGANHVKKGATVIDVGMNRLDGKLVGDVDFETVKDIADWITPVPGGVGPLTVTMLMKNTVTLGKLRRGL